MIWLWNPPATSHMGGVWEREIRTACSILNALIKTHGKSWKTLDDESLYPLFIEVWPLVIHDQLPSVIYRAHYLCHHQICLQRRPRSSCYLHETSLLLMYTVTRWKQTQHIAKEIWSKWRREFFHTLQKRRTNRRTNRNLVIDDIVLLKTDSENNHCPITRVIETFKDKQGVDQ